MNPQEAALHHRLRGQGLARGDLGQHCGWRGGASGDGVDGIWEVEEGDGRVGRVYFLAFGLEERGDDGTS